MPCAAEFQVSSIYIVYDNITLMRTLITSWLCCSPVPAVSWSRDSGQLPTGRASTSLSDTRLNIENVTTSDAGLYECLGRNSRGSTRHRIRLVVAGLSNWVVFFALYQSYFQCISCLHFSYRLRTLVFRRKNTHSRFLLYLHGKCLDLCKIFRLCLWGTKYSRDVKIKYSLLPMM